MSTAERNIDALAHPKTWTARLYRAWILRLLPILFYGSQVALASDSTVSKEYQVKAAFLYNFTKFVEWSSQRFATLDSPIVIGVLGKNPFGEELDKLVQNRKINGRAFTVQVVYSTADLARVHLLFVPTGEESRLAQPRIELPGVLTVGESDQFAALGGTIIFVTEADKVRFQINRDAAVRADIKISAQLLKLAVSNQKKE